MLFTSFFSIGQKSYYFSDLLPTNAHKVNTVDQRYFGTYTSKAAARSYEMSAEGIFIISTSISSISRETVRESSKYSVRGKYIHGVLKNDSLPCILEGEHYYFGVRNKDLLVDAKSLSKLTKMNSSQYIVNHSDNGLFTPTLFSFEGNKLIIKEFSYDFGTEAFVHIQNQQTTPSEHFDIVILTPTEKEFQQVMSNGVFTEGQVFKKKRKNG